MTDKEIIRAEIEKRLIESIENEWLTEIAEYESLLSFIDSIHVNPCEGCINRKGCVTCENGELRETVQEEPVSEPNKELAETYLAVFNKKFPILPSLKGKQLADYKNFLNKCQQIFGLKEWGIRPIQSKLFEKLTLLWAAWGAEHLQGVGRQDEKEQDISLSEDLEKVVEEIVDPTVLNAYGVKEIANRLRRTMIEPISEDLEKVFDKYSEGIESVYSNDMFDRGDITRACKFGAQCQKEQDVKKIETAIDFSFHGGRCQKEEEMLKNAIDANCFGFQGDALFSFKLPADKYLVGSKVKVFVIK